MNFTNKVIWITGASSGIGKALAIQLSHLDCKLILSSRREAELNIVKSQCHNPDNVAIVAFDLADYNMMKPVAKKAISIFGSIDILINNGGISQRSLIIDTDISVDKKLNCFCRSAMVGSLASIASSFRMRSCSSFITLTTIPITMFKKAKAVKKMKDR